MTKRFLGLISLLLVIGFWLCSTLVSSCLDNKDSWRDSETGVLLVKPTSIERLEAFVKSKEDKLKIDLSKMNLTRSIHIDDTFNNKDTLIIDGGKGYFPDFRITTNAKNLIIRNIAVKNSDTFLKMNNMYVTLEIESLYVEVESADAVILNEGERCLLIIINENRIKANKNEFVGILAKNLEIFSKGSSASKLEIYGKKALMCEGELVVNKNVELYCYDGDGKSNSIGQGKIPPIIHET